MPVKYARDNAPTKECWLCNGEGYLYDEIGTERATGAVIEQKTECKECHGTGVVDIEPDGAAMEEQWERERYSEVE